MFQHNNFLAYGVEFRTNNPKSFPTVRLMVPLPLSALEESGDFMQRQTITEVQFW